MEVLRRHPIRLSDVGSTHTKPAAPSEEPDGSVPKGDGSLSVFASAVTNIYTSSRTAAVIKSDGSLWMWGSNDFGQIGNGSKERADNPVKILDDVAYVSLDPYFSAAIKNDGSLWMWGSNRYGQLGSIELGNDQNEQGLRIQTIPTKVMDEVCFVSLGEVNTGIIKTDGSLWICGHNYYGQIGNGLSSEFEPFTKVMDDVSFVTFGDGIVNAMKKDSSLWTWGANFSGGLGNGENGTKEPNPIPTKVLENVSAVKTGGFAGFQNTAAILNDGTLMVWGGNQFGQLGIGQGGNGLEAWGRPAQTVPQSIFSNIVAVEFSRFVNVNTAMALNDNGELYAWGENAGGTVPNNSSDYVVEPVKIMENVESIALCNNVAAAITTDGTLWAWGEISGVTSAPIEVAENVKSVAALDKTLVLTKDDGSLWGMGQSAELRKVLD